VTVIPIARYLVHFGQGGAFERAEAGREAAATLESLDPRAAEELARKLAEALARGHEEGRAVAAEQFDRELAAARAALVAHMAAEREAWLAQEGARLGSAVTAAFEQLEASLAGSVARILEPLIGEALRHKALDELADTLSVLLAGEPGLIKVSGPQSLLDGLRDRLEPGCAAIEYAPGAGVDVSVVAGHTVIETRLQAWLDRIRLAME